jgi:hypothetical protein
MLATGRDTGVTVAVVVDEQPVAALTVTEYVPAEAGKVGVVAPVFQRYVLPPEAVSNVLCPAHTVSVPVMLATGRTTGVTVVVAEAEQPVAAVTVTE